MNDKGKFDVNSPRYFTIISHEGIEQFIAYKQDNGKWKFPERAIKLIHNGAVFTWNDSGDEEWYERGINR